ncbi:MAG: GTP-binding protein [Alphaproteobacteria bacterium]|nr:GTP-binding protein [Alphaproteobacteria bacterium]
MTARKIMLLGEIGVGKTSLVNRFVHGKFGTNYMPTINVEIYTHKLEQTASREAMTLLIWDTDGNFGETIFSSVYMKNAAAALIVGDAARPATLSAMGALASGWRQARPGRPLFLLLNKSDLIEETADGQYTALPSLPAIDTPVFHTSAKTGQNVETAFHAAADTIQRRGL